MVYEFQEVSRSLSCFPKIPEIPADIPPIKAVTKINKKAFPFNGNKTAILFARVKSLLLLSQKV